MSHPDYPASDLGFEIQLKSCDLGQGGQQLSTTSLHLVQLLGLLVREQWTTVHPWPNKPII